MRWMVLVTAAMHTVSGDDASALDQAGSFDAGCYLKGWAYASGGDADHPELLSAVGGEFSVATCQAECATTLGCIFFNFDVIALSCALGSAGTREGDLGVMMPLNQWFGKSTTVISGAADCSATQYLTEAAKPTNDPAGNCIRVHTSYGNGATGGCSNAGVAAYVYVASQSRADFLATQPWFPNKAVVEAVVTAAACKQKCIDSDRKCAFWDWTGLLGADSRECWLKRAVDCTPAYSIKWGSASGARSCDPNDVDTRCDGDDCDAGGGGTQTGGDGNDNTGNGQGPATGQEYPRPKTPETAAVLRAKALVAQMTLEEKVNYTNGVGWGSPGYYDIIDGFYVGNIPGVPRLNVPSINMQDAAQGFRTTDQRMYGQVTSWPCGLGVAATWDRALMKEWASSMAAEFRAKGANTLLGPSVNIHRVARGGRNGEYISGEDPFLGAALASGYVQGVQSQKVMAVMKHYALNNQETHRNDGSSNVDDRTMQEIYLPPFRGAVEAGVASVMCGYNLVNNVHACANGKLLNRDLKERMAFTGFVMSDWWAIHAPNYQAAGLDMNMPGNDHFFDSANMVGTVATVDDMVTRIFAGMIDVGVMDAPTCNTGADCEYLMYNVTATSPAHGKLARTIAAQSAVLLKNDGEVLPLQPGTTVAVVGTACDAPYNLEDLTGKWDLGNYYVLGGSGRVINPATTSIVDGIKAMAAPLGVTVKQRTDVDDVTDASMKAELTSIIASADVVIACGATTSTEATDRENLLVDQDEFLQFVGSIAASTGTKAVALLQLPGTIVTTSFQDNFNGIGAMFLAGQATGDAWADVLFGAVNPVGRLPITFPVVGDSTDTIEPCPELDCNYVEKLAVGYRALEGKSVNFPFGHGLSYTSFTYSNFAELDSTAMCTKGSAVAASSRGGQARSPLVTCIRATVTNDGAVAGAELAQLYVRFPQRADDPDVAVLKGFAKTQVLAAGASEDVYFGLTARDLSVWSEASSMFAPVTGGTFSASVGASSRDLRLSLDFRPSLASDQTTKKGGGGGAATAAVVVVVVLVVLVGVFGYSYRHRTGKSTSYSIWADNDDGESDDDETL